MSEQSVKNTKRSELDRLSNVVAYQNEAINNLNYKVRKLRREQKSTSVAVLFLCVSVLCLCAVVGEVKVGGVVRG